MSSYSKIVKEQFNKAWETNETEFESYERNRLLKHWLDSQRNDGQTALDIGCGNGVVSEYLHSVGFEVTGIDLSEVGIESAKQRVPGIFKVVDNDGTLPFEDNTFDAVFWGDNVEHLLDPASTLNEIRRVLKPNGRLLVSCPNVGLLKFRLIYLLRGAMPRHEGHVNPPWAWHHIRFFNPPILRQFLTQGGFRVKRLSATAGGPIQDRLARWMPGAFGTVLLAEAIALPTANQLPIQRAA